jgi:hypothetical protein
LILESDKHKIFLTGVYMVFKYGKQFRFDPSFIKIFQVLMENDSAVIYRLIILDGLTS